MSNVALSVIGAGSYGTALAIAVASKGLKVILWSYKEDSANEMRQTRRNERYLPSIEFPPSLEITSDLKFAVESTDNILVVVPSFAFKSTLLEIKKYAHNETKIAWATKGLCKETSSLLSESVQEIFPNIKMAALSGPTFAKELAASMPTAIAIAGNDKEFIQNMIEIMHTPYFRIYESSDFIALQLGGAVKNVIAIGAGMSDGLGFGANARTALITRGLAEIIRLGLALGASERGFMGMSGLGDLMLTCTDAQSRNRTFGYLLGQGYTVEDALKKVGQVVEGYNMTVEVKVLAQKLNVDMPICNEIYEVLINGRSGKEAAKSLLSRSQKKE